MDVAALKALLDLPLWVAFDLDSDEVAEVTDAVAKAATDCATE